METRTAAWNSATCACCSRFVRTKGRQSLLLYPRHGGRPTCWKRPIPEWDERPEESRSRNSRAPDRVGFVFLPRFTRWKPSKKSRTYSKEVHLGSLSLLHLRSLFSKRTGMTGTIGHETGCRRKVERQGEGSFRPINLQQSRKI